MASPQQRHRQGEEARKSRKTVELSESEPQLSLPISFMTSSRPACRSDDRVNLLACMPKNRDETVALGLSTRLAQSHVPGLISQGFSCLLQGHLQANCRGYRTPFPLPPPD